jgi:hypothetical protein
MGLTVTFELECVNDMDTVSALLLSEDRQHSRPSLYCC